MAGDNQNTAMQGQTITKTRVDTLSVSFLPQSFCNVKRLGYGSWESPVWKKTESRFGWKSSSRTEEENEGKSGKVDYMIKDTWIWINLQSSFKRSSK